MQAPPLELGDEGTPEEELAFRERLEAVVEQKRLALEDPGPPWKEWFLFDGAKWWMGLLFLIFDTWIVAGGLEAGLLVVGVLLLIPATYLELLFWRFLWYLPPDGTSMGQRFHPSWIRPVEFGRWTPEGTTVRTLGRDALAPEGVNPREFL
jgi:hypothetical protein